MAAPSKKAQAWVLFDRIVGNAAAQEQFEQGPWRGSTYEPDFDTLELLLGVPLFLDAPSQSGVPALALDVWTAHELRRAGFDPDAVWPRATHPRVVSAPIMKLLEGYPAKQRDELWRQISRATPIPGVAAAEANILGKHYIKQVDVVMSAWDTGPELLISTKRMDSSFGKNAANRIEESYGDAKNLRSRHPLAAHGFLYGLRSTILDTEAAKAHWLIDLLGKLGREDDAYDAVCLLMLDYDSKPPAGSDGGHEDEADPSAAITSRDESVVTIHAKGTESDSAPDESFDADLAQLPDVRILHDAVPEELQAGRFFKVMVEHVLRATPVSMHRRARAKRGWPTL